MHPDAGRLRSGDARERHFGLNWQVRRILIGVLSAALMLLPACGAEPVVHEAEIVIRNGAVIGAPVVISARQGDSVNLLIDSDADATLHAHGLPEAATVPAGKPTMISLDAAYIGEFDIELHPAPAANNGMLAMGEESHQGMAMDSMEMGSMIHGLPVPAPAGMSVSISLTPDTVDGLNLHIMPTGFAWSPQGAGSAHVDGEGHAHVYVDGVKYARAYGPWLHLAGLEPGARQVRVTLNANNHGEYTIAGETVAAEASAEVAATGLAMIVTKLSVSAS